MQFPSKGGRSQKFPHGITHVRVPVPVKPVIELIIQRYKQLYGSDCDPDGQLMIYRVYAFLAQDTNHQFEDDVKKMT